MFFFVNDIKLNMKIFWIVSIVILFRSKYTIHCGDIVFCICFSPL